MRISCPYRSLILLTCHPLLAPLTDAFSSFPCLLCLIQTIGRRPALFFLPSRQHVSLTLLKIQPMSARLANQEVLQRHSVSLLYEHSCFSWYLARKSSPKSQELNFLCTRLGRHFKSKPLSIVPVLRWKRETDSERMERGVRIKTINSCFVVHDVYFSSFKSNYWENDHQLHYLRVWGASIFASDQYNY